MAWKEVLVVLIGAVFLITRPGQSALTIRTERIRIPEGFEVGLGLTHPSIHKPAHKLS